MAATGYVAGWGDRRLAVGLDGHAGGDGGERLGQGQQHPQHRRPHQHGAEDVQPHEELGHAGEVLEVAQPALQDDDRQQGRAPLHGHVAHHLPTHAQHQGDDHGRGRPRSGRCGPWPPSAPRTTGARRRRRRRGGRPRSRASRPASPAAPTPRRGGPGAARPAPPAGWWARAARRGRRGGWPGGAGPRRRPTSRAESRKWPWTTIGWTWSFTTRAPSRIWATTPATRPQDSRTGPPTRPLPAQGAEHGQGHRHRHHAGDESVAELDPGVVGRLAVGHQLARLAAGPRRAPQPRAGEAHGGAGDDDGHQRPQGDRG